MGKLQEGFDMRDFPKQWNEGYDFKDPQNIAVIVAVDSYSLVADTEEYSRGQDVPSHWGTNQVLEIGKTDSGEDICRKTITVFPNNMLSLQRHLGREELWEVESGVLTVISNGERHDVPAGESIKLPKGSVHCMINAGDEDVTVIETQTGVCREKDNVRLVDFGGRPTYPLTTEIEYESAILYRSIQADIMAKPSYQAKCEQEKNHG